MSILSMARTLATALVFIAVMLTAYAQQIPNSISRDEYAMYSAFLKSSFAKRPPQHLFISSHTFSYADACGRAHAKAVVPDSLVQQLRAFGKTEYKLELSPQGRNLRIPRRYKAVDDWRHVPEKPGIYWLVTFSRVAFDGTHTKALFAYRSSCATGQCGGGGGVYANKEKGAWVFEFEPTDCQWMY